MALSTEIKQALCKVCRRKTVCDAVGCEHFYYSDRNSCSGYTLPYGLYGDLLTRAVLCSGVLPPAKDAWLRLEDWPFVMIVSLGRDQPINISVSVGLGEVYIYQVNSVDDPEAVLAVLKEAHKLTVPGRAA